MEVVKDSTIGDLLNRVNIQEKLVVVEQNQQIINKAVYNQTTMNLQFIIEQSDIPVIVDAGIGSPSDAAYAMELGADGVLLNTAVSGAKDPIRMAEAMKLAVQSGRLGYEAGRIPKRMDGMKSSPDTAMIE